LIVKEVMNNNPIYVEVPSKRMAALAVMLKNEVSSAPVIRKGKLTLAGMISMKELMSRTETDQTALIMNNRPPKVRPKDPVQKAAKAIIKSGFRVVPVVDDDGKLLGVVSVEDLLQKAADETAFSQTVDDYVSPGFPSVWVGTPISVAYKIMRYYGADTLTILDDSGKARGFLTEFDFLKQLEEEYSRSKSPMQAASEGEDWDWSVAPVLYMGSKGLTFPDKPVSEIPTRRLPTLPSGTSIRVAVEEMLKNNSPQVAVGTEDYVHGMVFDISLVGNLLMP
jgi:CBS domain-containing protein